MALRPERDLTGYEAAQVRALTELIQINADYEHRKINGLTFNTEMARLTSILGLPFMQAVDQVTASLGWTSREINRLGDRPNQNHRIVKLYDVARDRLRANEARAYLHSLRVDPQALADLVREATGANSVLVGYTEADHINPQTAMSVAR